jgi:hypothetical protein
MGGKTHCWLVVIVAILSAVQLCTPSVLFAATMSVTSTQDLNFGKMACGSGCSGTVTINTSGVRASSGSVVLLGSVFSPAGFTINGNAGSPYTLTLPSTFTIISGADHITVSAVTSSIPIAGVLPAGGTLPFTVGGTLTVGSAQRNSTYSGAIVISVD